MKAKKGVHAMENLAVRQVSPNSAKASIVRAFKKKRPIFIWGPPGIGKSDIVRQIGDNMEAHVIDIRLSLWEPTDIKGIPYFDSKQGTMVWAPPSELPDAKTAKKHKSRLTARRIAYWKPKRNASLNLYQMKTIKRSDSPNRLVKQFLQKV